MIPALIVAALVGAWAWKTGELRALRFGDVAAAVAAIVAIRMFSKGEVPLALLAGGGAAWWLWFRRAGERGEAQGGIMSAEEACRLLDVPPDADSETVRSAHRRLIARVHPDVGGSADLTARVNAARDRLLSVRGSRS
ncbi:molecular chaperone DnaJ [Sphingomonas oleivorans]|uniref:molecular chaperone DnaJ n=1 Tax=Sphingomonas oleivorans TaxID=1735121 RepID=UPI001A9EA4E1|nr:molecular chaperone DnaJ [Sphingomonas oleivorans]